jgi:glycosyltransferase involved in cell wall biosynthesis
MRALRDLRGQGYRERLEADLRSARDIGILAPVRFAFDRARPAYRKAYERPQPLVSICITTFNRGRLLVERSVASSIAQTYPNIQIIVVGDCCTDDTEQLMANVTDPRVTFLNLPERGKYPEDPELRWMVAGCVPFNHALTMAKGDFITHLDDDDEYTPDRIEKLVRFAQESRADIVFHPFTFETAEGEWIVNEAERFAYGLATTSSVFYHRWFRSIEGDLKAYRYREPGDWCRFRKMRYLRARILRHPDVMLRHYKERNQSSVPVQPHSQDS